MKLIPLDLRFFSLPLYHVPKNRRKFFFCLKIVSGIGKSQKLDLMRVDIRCFKPVTDEQVFYDKFLCDKFYSLVCTRNVDKFFYDKCTCSKASMLAFEQVHLS